MRRAFKVLGSLRLPPLRPAPSVAGQVDHLNDRIVRGWAWSPRQPKRRLILDVFYRDIFLGQAFAGAYRSDLKTHGIGDGRHAFIFHLPADVPRSFDAADVCVATAGPQRRTIPQAAALTLGDRSRRLPADHRRLLGPYLASLPQRDREEPLATDIGHRPRIDALVAEPPEFGLSAFLIHIAQKYGWRVEQGRQASLLRWYLETYATEHGPRRVPLSRGDIARLNESGSSHRPVPMDLASDEIALSGEDAIHRWAAEVSCRLFVDDCLVTDDQAARLRAMANGQEHLRYPLSEFMRVVCNETAILRSFRAERDMDRQSVYALLFVMALRRPSILCFLPQPWSKQLLDTHGLLDAIIARLFDGDAASMAAALRARLRETAFDIERGVWRPNDYEGHRIRGGGATVAGPARVDVQIFGPFHRRMGLGESCRRVARALAGTPFSINLVDYAIGSARSDVETEMACRAPLPSRLNILHLNLEEVPEAFAFLPDVFSNTPTIAIPYWELDRPSAVHRLGLAIVDELWVASRFLAHVFKDAGPAVQWIGMSADETPVPGLSQTAALRARYGLGPSTFAFLTVSDALSWVQRKNPLDVVLAFQAAFEAHEDVALVVKTHNLNGPLSAEQTRYWRQIVSLCEADPRIAFIDASFDHDTQRTLLAACDCLVSLHRAEGLGLDIVDALWIGKPVIATAYSGPTDLCTPQTAWMVESDLVPVAPSDYSFVERGHVWAAPRQSAAVAALRSVYADPPTRLRKVQAARSLVEDVATERVFAQRLEHRITSLFERA